MSRRHRSLPERVLHRIESLALYALLLLVKLLPLDRSSATFAWVARKLGPILPVSNTARRNLRHAFPEMPAEQVEETVRQVWDNLGRYMAEYPHLGDLWDFDPTQPNPQGRVQVDGIEQFLAVRDGNRPTVVFTAHTGNWELLPFAAAEHGLELAVLYRPPNNPYAADMVQKARGKAGGELLPNNLEGLSRAVARLEAGGTVGMLVDQHYGKGMPVPFFGRPAMTSAAIAKLALRHGCEVRGARVERLEGSRFRVSLTPPLAVARTGDEARDLLALLTQINRTIEDWVRERPGQWLWLHRRWRPEAEQAAAALAAKLGADAPPR